MLDMCRTRVRVTLRLTNVEMATNKPGQKCLDSPAKPNRRDILNVVTMSMGLTLVMELLTLEFAALVLPMLEYAVTQFAVGLGRLV